MAELTPIVKDSFLQFAGAVLQSRALPDVRDCMKPSARQIFYCLYTDKFVHSKPFQKTLKAIGSAFRMYIHGDSSAEGIIMRAGQPFSMRYPLVEVEGSYGTLIASGSWAAPRYTASRLSPLAEYLFADIGKEVIEEWRWNYDDTEQYPMVLPSKGFFNLVNGAYGIGVGASASIPQYNLRELNEALIKLLWNPEISFDEIYCAPDFATGAILLNADEIKESHRKGSGFACKLRSVVEYSSSERCFIVTEIPYMTYTETICNELEELINSENNPGIERFNDLTGETPLIKIYLTKNANPDKVLKYLYKNTSLQSHYGINFTMLENGRYPRVFTWKEILQAHLEHERKVYINGYSFDLRKIKARLHIIDGLLKAIDMIDEVVKIIKEAADIKNASIRLQRLLNITEYQAKAILDIKLSRLAHLEVTKLQNEYTSLTEEKNRIESILADETLLKKEMEKGFREVAQKFGDARRTRILNVEKDEDEVVEKKQLSLSFTNKGAVFVTETSSLYSQRRNGVGTKFKLEPEEFIVDNLVGENTDTILFFTKKGMYYHMNLGVFNIGEKQYLSNFNISGDITAAALVNKKDSDKNIVFITKNGLIKKSKLSEYNLKRSTGAQALKLDDGDEIVSTLFINDERIGILSRDGQFIMIESTPIRALGRLARGIIGIKLSPSDYVVSARAISKDSRYLFSITSDGYGKNTTLSEFNITNTNTKGVKIQKSDNLCDFIPIEKQGEILVNSNTTQIRIKSTDIPTLSRGALGVKLMKLTDNYIIGISSL